MKRKELKTLAQKIVKYERLIQSTTDKKVRADAEQKINELTGHVDSIEDVFVLDELVMELLEKK